MSLVRPTVPDRFWKPGDGIAPSSECVDGDAFTFRAGESSMGRSALATGRTPDASRCAACATAACVM